MASDSSTSTGANDAAEHRGRSGQSDSHRQEPTSHAWLSLDGRAGVEASSEQDGYPVTGPLQSLPANEWRAAESGPQVIRLQFGTPQRLHRIRLVFREVERARTQEFTLFCTAAGGERREIVRQQYTFAPNGGATTETEEYAL